MVKRPFRFFSSGLGVPFGNICCDSPDGSAHTEAGKDHRNYTHASDLTMIRVWLHGIVLHFWTKPMYGQFTMHCRRIIRDFINLMWIEMIFPENHSGGMVITIATQVWSGNDAKNNICYQSENSKKNMLTFVKATLLLWTGIPFLKYSLPFCKWKTELNATWKILISKFWKESTINAFGLLQDAATGTINNIMAMIILALLQGYFVLYS